MAGLRTRVTPAQDESKTHILSFRDVMPLCYLTNKRMDNGDLVLVLESAPPRTLKLRQVVDYFFSVSDTESPDLSQQIDVLRTELRDSRNRLKALRVFLQDAGVPDEISIEDSVAARRRTGCARYPPRNGLGTAARKHTVRRRRAQRLPQRRRRRPQSGRRSTRTGNALEPAGTAALPVRRRPTQTRTSRRVTTTLRRAVRPCLPRMPDDARQRR